MNKIDQLAYFLPTYFWPRTTTSGCRRSARHRKVLARLLSDGQPLAVLPGETIRPIDSRLPSLAG